MFYKPKVNDIVLVKHSNSLIEITHLNSNRDVSGTFLRCHVKEREKERGYLFCINDLKLIWRR